MLDDLGSKYDLVACNIRPEGAYAPEKVKPRPRRLTVAIIVLTCTQGAKSRI